MNTKISNKRKSVAKATTPNKIQKLTRTPVLKSSNGNKSPKSSKINQKNKTNGAKITPKGKKPKQIEEEEIDDSDELNDSDISNDAADSDNEDAQIGIADSDEAGTDSDDDVEADSDNDVEADSDDAAEVEHADSDEAEANSDEAVDSDEADDSEEAEEDSDEDAKKDENDLNKNSDGDVDETKKNEGKAKKYSVVVRGLTTRREIDLFFHDCNILSHYIVYNHTTHLPSGYSYVTFKDKESMEKALERNGRKVNGFKISVEVQKEKKITEFCVLVKGLGRKLVVNKLFNNCQVTWWYSLLDPITKEPNGRAYVSFEDKESLEKALDYNLKEYFGHIIVVEPMNKAEIESELKHKEIPKFNENLFSAFVSGISSELKLKAIFKDCKVLRVCMSENRSAKNFYEKAFVYFEDEESLQKALLLHNTEYDGCVLKVTRRYCDVNVANIHSESDIKNIFKDCNIQSFFMRTNRATNEITGAVVNFKDKESFQKALSKNGTELGGENIRVTIFKYAKPPVSNHSRTPYKPFNKPVMKNKFTPQQLLLQQLKQQAQHLEREINKTSKPHFKKHTNSKF